MNNPFNAVYLNSVLTVYADVQDDVNVSSATVTFPSNAVENMAVDTTAGRTASDKVYAFNKPLTFDEYAAIRGQEIVITITTDSGTTYTKSLTVN